MKMIKKIIIAVGIIAAMSVLGSGQVKAGAIEDQAAATTNQWLVTNVYGGDVQLALADPNYITLYNNIYPAFLMQAQNVDVPQITPVQQPVAAPAVQQQAAVLPVQQQTAVLPVQQQAAVPVAACSYILNTNTKVFHYPTCGSVKRMKDKNKKPFNGTRDQAIASGYKSCGNCHP